MHRLFVSVAFLVCGVISEGSGWLIARMLVEVRDMSHVNEESHFVLIALLSLALQVVYMVIITSIFQLFKKKKIKPTFFILFLILVLTYCIIDLLVTFADTAYLAPALILSALLIAAISGCLYLFTDQLRIQRERLQLANLEERANNTSAASGTSPPRPRSADGQAGRLPLRASAPLERHAEYCFLMTGQGNERGAPETFYQGGKQHEA